MWKRSSRFHRHSSVSRVPEGLRVGIVGARGYTGAELTRLINRHPNLELVFAGSRELAGTEVPDTGGLLYESIGPDAIASRGVNGVFMALPDGAGEPYTDALQASDVTIVDISSDHRFDDDWVYGLPELNRSHIAGARRIANPGCYATAMQLALAPLLGLIEGVPAVFGVSGYSGAGTTPGPRNDPTRLAGNLMPYKLVGHTHEREATRHLGLPIRFFPHVHPAFRGLLVTAHIPLSSATTGDDLETLFRESYANEPLLEIQKPAPELRDGTGRDGVLIGGFEVSEDGHNAVVVAAEDNLLKGAAVQAVQNLNLAMGLAEMAGIESR